MTAMLIALVAGCVGYLIGFQHGVHVATFPKTAARDEQAVRLP